MPNNQHGMTKIPEPRKPFAILSVCILLLHIVYVIMYFTQSLPSALATTEIKEFIPMMFTIVGYATAIGSLYKSATIYLVLSHTVVMIVFSAIAFIN
ncbi:hypothetical protein [Aureibacillus halotolerans]|nr:hypothetical protein [Aureibacillus halotolerans]